MNKMLMMTGAIMVAFAMAGCVSSSPADRRAAYQEEFNRFKALPVAEQVASPNKEISACAKLSCDLFNEFHPMMKAYVAKVDSSREYVGFMNDIRYYVEEEGLANDAACKKVSDDVKVADMARADGDKLWPKICQGIAAARELDPKKQLIQIANLTVRNKNIVERVKKLPDSFKDESFQAKLQRSKECSAISEQLADVGECLLFLGDQYSRVVELEGFAK